MNISIRNRCLSTCAALLVTAQAVLAQAVDYKGNLAKIPATDPAATEAPQLLPAIKGQHPRLLFTKAEIDQLRTRIPQDPILKKAYDDLSAWSKRVKIAPEAKPAVVTNDTSALVQSGQNNPGLVYAYALDRDPNVKQAILDLLNMMLQQPYWADTAELDSNMGAGNNMFMVGLMFDVIHADLDPDLRQKLAQKILTHCRRMYYLGHKQLSLMPIKYWQQDPQNNHRWHRAAGLTACLLAIADEPGVDTSYLQQQLKKEIDFLIKWLPSDGDTHEGAGYQQFGYFYLVTAAQMMDRAYGTEYMKAPGFKNAWAQQVYYWAPGRQSNMSFGDDMNGHTVFNTYDAAFFVGPSLSRDPNVQAALVRRYEKLQTFATNPRPYKAPWSILAFYDPTVSGGDYKSLPTYRLFADLGAATMRDSWEDDAFCFAFKCGPYGGLRLNEYRHTVLDDGKPHYINVAHDDPDANSFSLASSGDFLFHPGLYSFSKITSQQNTITVNDKGQVNEGTDYMQPVPGVDMRTLSYLTAWKTTPEGRIIVEGETGKAYKDLQSFRRTAVWMPGEYLLLLDDIRAAGRNKITWRGTVEKGMFENPELGKCYITTKSGLRLDFQILANQPFTGAVDYLYLDGRFGNKLAQQFQFAAETDVIKFACLMDPWKKKPQMTLKEDVGVVTLTITAPTFTDTWTWKQAADSKTPTDLMCVRAGKEVLRVTPADVVKPE